MSMFSYETQGTNTYLVYKIEETDSVDSMSLGMLTNNSIPGLAPTVFTQMDADKYIKYNVSAKISVSQFFSGIVNKKRLVGVFSGIVNAMLSAEEYMIDPSTISLDLEYIFTDVSTCETELICVPVETEQKDINLALFFKNILFSTQFDQTENCDYVAKLMNYLNSTPVIVLNDFKKILHELNNESVQTKTEVVKTPPAQKVVPTPQPQPVVTPTPKTAEQKPAPSTNPVPQPQKQPISVPPVVEKKEEQPVQGKKIGMFDLLMHYSKENVELYKAQKAAGKSGPTAPSTPKETKTPTPPTGFAVPGKPSTGFAIPGQPAPAVTQTASSTTPAPQSPVRQNSSPQPVYTPPQQPAPQTKQTSFGETTVLGGGGIGETTVLNAVNPTQTASPYLVRLKNNERIPLNKPVFRVGKERSYVDYFIGDNTAISRSHANFITRDGEYFVVDTNSTNHTFVNGTMIQSNNEVKINDGDKIRLANEDFDFKLY